MGLIWHVLAIFGACQNMQLMVIIYLAKLAGFRSCYGAAKGFLKCGYAIS